MITTQTTTFPLWYEKFDNSPRHCFEGNTGVMYLARGGANKKKCHLHTNKDRAAGRVEWMRFIHMLNTLNGGEYFLGDVKLLNKPGYTMLAPEYAGRVAYCESYKNHSVRVFTNTDEGWAVIECDDPAYFDLFTAAYEKVQETYR